MGTYPAKRGPRPCTRQIGTLRYTVIRPPHHRQTKDPLFCPRTFGSQIGRGLPRNTMLLEGTSDNRYDLYLWSVGPTASAIASRSSRASISSRRTYG